MEHTTSSIIQRLQEMRALAKLIGDAPTFLTSLQQLPCMAKGDASVLVTGETGTGKELVARAIHYSGSRASYPFTAVNCGSLPDTLLENELFGHEKGAFTNAEIRRPGIVAQAEAGTLFLDEVEALSRRGQVVLLRLLQDKTFRPLGSTREQKANIRIISASNAPLEHLIKAGAFRADLYYRLAVFTISLPPLRERHVDILRLAGHFLTKHPRADGQRRSLSTEASAALVAYDWPGNVRELENAMIRGVEGSDTELISSDVLGLCCQAEDDPSSLPRLHTDSFHESKGGHAGITKYSIKSVLLLGFLLAYTSP